MVLFTRQHRPRIWRNHHNERNIREAFAEQKWERASNQTQYQFESINLAAAASHLIFKSMFIIIIIGTPEKTCSGLPNQSYRTIRIPSTRFPAHILLVLHRSWSTEVSRTMSVCGNGAFSVNDFRFMCGEWSVVRLVCDLQYHGVSFGVRRRSVSICSLGCLLCLPPQNKFLMHITVLFARTLLRTCCVPFAPTELYCFRFGSIFYYCCADVSVLATTASHQSVSTSLRRQREYRCRFGYQLCGTPHRSMSWTVPMSLDKCHWHSHIRRWNLIKY